MSKSSDYWRKREKEWEKEYEKRQEYWDSQIWAIYKQLQEDMQAEIDAWYMKYASKEGLTMAQAKQTVSKADQDYYARRAAELVRLAQEDMATGSSDNAKIYFSETANREMRLYNTAMKVNRMQLIQSMLDLQVAKASGKVHTEMEKALIERAQQVYRNNAKILGPTVIGNIKRITELINSSFHGATFSERIWNSQAPSLARNVQNTLARLLVMGESPMRFRSQLVQDSKQSTKAAYKAAGRLLRTESARVQTQAMVSTIKEIGFTQYEFISGAKCCPECQALDGKILDLKGSSYGTDMPPMHPNCRCTIAPYSDREEYEKWLDSYAEQGGEEQEDPTNESESSKRGINQDTTINRKYIASQEYRKKFEQIEPDAKTNRIMVREARTLLQLFQGTNAEGMAFINPQTGEVLVNHHEKSNRSVTATHKMQQMVMDNPNQIIGIHNHPGSSSPSGADIIGMAQRKYKYGIVCGHNGTVYKYSADNAEEILRHSSNQIDYVLSELDELTSKYQSGQYEVEKKRILDKLLMMGIRMEIF